MWRGLGIKNITGVARDTLKLYFTLTIKILSVSLISVSHFEPFPTLFQVIRYNTHEPIHGASFLLPTKALKYGTVYIPWSTYMSLHLQSRCFLRQQRKEPYFSGTLPKRCFLEFFYILYGSQHMFQTASISNFLSHKLKFYHDWLFVGQKEAKYLLPLNRPCVEAILRVDK